LASLRQPTKHLLDPVQPSFDGMSVHLERGCSGSRIASCGEVGAKRAAQDIGIPAGAERSKKDLV
jgi:hypothetical protein